MSIEAVDIPAVAERPQTEADLESERRQAIIDNGLTELVSKLFANPDITLNQEQLGLTHQIVELNLDSLLDKERHAIERRYGLLGEEPSTFEAIGQKLDINKSKAIQIHSRALRRLRHPNRLGNLRETLGISVNSTSEAA